LYSIDQYAYNNRIRGVDPACKVLLSFSVLVLCLLLDKPQVGIVAVVWIYLLAVQVAGLEWQVFGRILLAEGSFLILATIGVVLSVSLFSPVNLAQWTVNVGPLWISSSPEALYQGGNLIARALGATSAMNFLTLTTPLVDLLELSRRWHAPVILVDLTVIMYRFIFVLLDSLNTMTIAQKSRLGYSTSYRRAMASAGLLGSRLFINAYQQSRRLQIALESRGYEGGDLRVLPTSYQPNHKLIWLGFSVAVSLLAVWALL